MYYFFSAYITFNYNWGNECLVNGEITIFSYNQIKYQQLEYVFKSHCFMQLLSCIISSSIPYPAILLLDNWQGWWVRHPNHSSFIYSQSPKAKIWSAYFQEGRLAEDPGITGPLVTFTRQGPENISCYGECVRNIFAQQYDTVNFLHARLNA